MKKKELAGYISKKPEELRKELLELKLELAKTKINIGSGREKNLKKAKNIGKNIAQISTFLKYKSAEKLLDGSDTDKKEL